MLVQTSKKRKDNRPDIVINDNEQKTCMMFDMTIPSKRNSYSKEVEKLSKYKDMKIEVTQILGVKATTIPVVTGVLGLIKKELETGKPNHCKPKSKR